MKRGDTIEVMWWDIQTESTGDPKEAIPALRYTVGYFYQWVKGKNGEYLVTTPTREEDVDLTHCSGWDAFPKAIVLAIKPLLPHTVSDADEIKTGKVRAKARRPTQKGGRRTK